MTLQQLRYFKLVCDLGSVSAAAERMFVSQSAVSVAIKELETEYAVPLFRRNGRRLVLTTEGNTLLQLANRTLDDADDLARAMKNLADRRSPIAFGITTMLAAIMLPEIYAEVSKALPDVQLQITEGGLSELLDQLGRRKLRLAVLPRSSFGAADDTYNRVPLLQLEYGYCVAKNHRLAGREAVSVAEIGSDPLITFREGYTQKALTASLFRERGLEPNILHSSGQLSTIMEMVGKNGFGCLFFMELRALRPDLCFLHLKPEIMFDAELVWRKDLALNRDETLLIDCIRQYYA